jgi:hypothetical protein
MSHSILYAARLAAGITRDAIANETKLSPWVIDAIELGRYDRLPGGVYARAYVRAYARAVGVDSAEALAQLGPALPEIHVELVDIVSVREPPMRELSRYRAAALTDAAVVVAITGFHIAGSAVTVGVGAWEIVRAAPVALSALMVVTTLVYFGLLGATGVGTAGARLFAVEFVSRPSAPLDVGVLLRRAVAYLRNEASLLFAARRIPQ